MSNENSLRLVRADNGFDLMIGDRLMLRHTTAGPAIHLGAGDPRVTCSHGNYRIRSRRKWKRPLPQFEIQRDDPAGIAVRLSERGGAAAFLAAEPVSGHPGLIRLTVSGSPTPGGSEPPAQPPSHNRVWITLPCEPGEPAYGGGQQFSRFNLRGSRLPLWSGEQGVGRGFNLTTLAANLHSGAGGHWHSTYFPQPTYVTESGRVVHAETDSYALFAFGGTTETLEFWQPDVTLILGAAPGGGGNAGRAVAAGGGGNAGRAVAAVAAAANAGRISTPLATAVSTLSGYLGRQPRLPEWTHDGMWLGLQGGSHVIREKVARAKAAGIPLGGVWVQDWEGRRVTAFGSQLFWDWRYDRKLYPDLPELIEELKAEGVRFLGYANPFLAIEGELYKEASANGYCVKSADGSDAMIVVTTFPAALVDLTNPDAFNWFKNVIKKNMIGIGLSGWMADYGEYLPTDAVLADGDPMRFHNRFPAEWARLNHEAISEAGKLDDVLIFMRAGYTGSSKYANALWAGDQLVDWSRHDGLPSVLPSALSSGMGGLGVNHSDLGGFTSLFGRRRSKELFLRWADHCAFTPIMRSHESNRPGDNWQWDSDTETTAHLARMARVFVALAPYRRAVLDEYARTGLPTVRPVQMHYREWDDGRNRRPRAYLPGEYLFGRDLLVHPVVGRGVSRAKVNLPEGEWVHLWTGNVNRGGLVTVDAPAGQPPVFYLEDSEHTELFAGMRG